MQAKWGLIAVIALVIAMMLVTVAMSGCPKADVPNPDEGMILPDDVAPPGDVPVDAPDEGTDAPADGDAPVDDDAAPAEGTDAPVDPEGDAPIVP